jgi:hypothetical protein
MEPITDNDRRILMNFKTDVCDKSKEIDPGEEYDWFGISYGYFIAKGLSIDHAHKLSIIARYDYHYWQ